MFSPDAVRSNERFTRAAPSTSGRAKSKFYQFQEAASFAFLRHARSAKLRASLAPRSRQSELMSK